MDASPVAPAVPILAMLTITTEQPIMTRYYNEWKARETFRVAKADALATARVRLTEERKALELCDRMSWTTDANVCRREIIRLESLIARLEA